MEAINGHEFLGQGEGRSVMINGRARDAADRLAQTEAPDQPCHSLSGHTPASWRSSRSEEWGERESLGSTQRCGSLP